MKKILIDKLFFKMFGIIGILIVGLCQGLIILKNRMQDKKGNK